MKFKQYIKSRINKNKIEANYFNRFAFFACEQQNRRYGATETDWWKRRTETIVGWEWNQKLKRYLKLHMNKNSHLFNRKRVTITPSRKLQRNENNIVKRRN